MNRPPTREDLGKNFTPGVRFYFEYEVLEKHPGAIHDGFLPVKVKEEVCLSDYVYAVIIPAEYKDIVADIIPENLKGRVHYLERDGEDIWEWSEKVYQFTDRREEL